ncbi:hypothetical protein V6N13_021429 [Hibiscus sabdariffa]|uniref:1-(5-phosphoribosyl)-5-[(5-phosphoribosylamino)methylideneamino]imidazole-4-carboxamideisomerase n=1 Tax=Hibiscus sabdariffa TaxID=183260 RepID=A0ABR2NQ70_9ROSI
MGCICNIIVGLVNSILLSLGICLIVWGAYLSFKEVSSDCEKILAAPLLVIGNLVVLVSIIGLMGTACGSSICMMVYLSLMAVLILGVLLFTSFIFSVTNKTVSQVYDTGERMVEPKSPLDLSNWLHNKVTNEQNWKKIKSCLIDSRVCSAEKHTLDVDANVNVTKFFHEYFPSMVNNSLPELKAGCCRPPDVCGFKKVNDTNWEIPSKGPTANSKHDDCKAWSNDAGKLCFDCYSCKGGVIDNLKKEWRILALLNAEGFWENSKKTEISKMRSSSLHGSCSIRKLSSSISHSSNFRSSFYGFTNHPFPRAAVPSISFKSCHSPVRCAVSFRPCIDIHKVVNSVQNSKEDGSNLVTNFESDKSAAEFAELYKKDGLKGGHVIMLGADPLSQAAAIEALRAYPGGLQVGGGINLDNCLSYIDEGASHVIVTSYVFNNGQMDLQRLKSLVNVVGKQRLILDLSCRKKDDKYAIVTDRWQKFSDVFLDEEVLNFLSGFADEFLVHGVDVEGKKLGIDEDLVALLGKHSPIPVTYAGGVTVMDDLETIKAAGKGRVDVTVGSALDIFGGSLAYKDVVAWHESNRRGIH